MDAAFPFTAHVSRRPRRPKQKWDKDRKDRLTTLWLDPRRIPAELIADELETSPGAIYTKVHQLGLPPRTRGRARGAPKAGDPSGQRRFAGKTVKEGEDPRVDLKPWHPSLRIGTTIFPTRLVPAVQAERLLKSGEHNRKIGALAERGPWKGCRIYTLTLTERETCPRTCLEWKTCYGNNMHAAPRILVDRWFMPRLQVELAHLAAIHPEGIIVRLHVLGDFYSVEYVEFWRKALAEHAGLHLFIFTARQPNDPIGRAVLEMYADNLERVVVRISGYHGRYHGSQVVDRRADAVGVYCPAQSDERVSCASCMVCVRSDRTISFLRHG